MELKLLSIKKEEKGNIKLPKQFEEEIRPDLIKKIVLALQSNNRQPYGADPKAGMRSSAELSRRRRKYRGSYGIGISRVPRKILSRRGTRMNWVGAFAPGTVGGRKAHAPKAEKIWDMKINKKENSKAIRSALAATMVKGMVEERNHNIPENYPFIVEDKIESIKKTKDIIQVLKDLGFSQELERSEKKKIRAGKGKTRGRKYTKKKGILLVVSKECDLEKSAANIPGMDVVKIKDINAELLAPGAVPGRLTLFTDKAIETLEKENLFIR